MIIIIKLALVFINLLHISNGLNWGYKKIGNGSPLKYLPNDWHKLEPECSGDSQSPIDIDYKSTRYDATMKPLEIVKKWNSNFEIWNVTNKGHTGNLNNSKLDLTIYFIMIFSSVF